MGKANSADFVFRFEQSAGVDTDYAITAIGGSRELYEKLLRKVIRLMPANIEKMDEGIRPNGDFNSFSVMVHGIKGSLNQIGCSKLAEQAEELEMASKAGNRRYCVENYSRFREALLALHGAASEIAAQTNNNACSCPALKDNVPDYLDKLVAAKDALENYDSILASELLQDLSAHNFPEGDMALLSKAVEALDIFKYRMALEYIEMLLENYEK